jgi:3-methyladenine DNA glycosylase AlkC
MAEPLKNVYNDSFFNTFTLALENSLPNFNKKKFLKTVFEDNWEQKELKQRFQHLAHSLLPQLENDYKKRLEQLKLIITQLRKLGVNDNNFPYLFLADLISNTEEKNLPASLHAMEFVTQFVSCEFAVRQFIILYPQKMMQQLLKWSLHADYKVRRFSSEACRPRLPWGLALQQFIKNPEPIIPILENLKADESLFVQKSVANNLNDISKTHPELVIKLVNNWKKSKNKQTDWIVKHACRGLLKKGNEKVLGIFGTSVGVKAEVKEFKLDAEKLKIGETLSFSFTLVHTENEPVKLRLEYVIYYRKQNNSYTKKVFKITENHYETNKLYRFEKKQSFKNLTTRKHYSGDHFIGIIVNGREHSKLSFVLK